MIAMLAGLGGLLLLYGLLRAFANSTLAQAKQALVLGSAALGAALVVVMILAGRANMALTAGIFFGPALWRWWQGFQAKQAFSRNAADGETAVDTATLEMRLDLATGAMRGRVKRGVFEGQSLDDLAVPRLLELLADCRAEDPDSVPLLEAWLDRVAPEWRVSEPAPAAMMDRAAALTLLGLVEGASETDIRAAHRRAMREAHPDAGGDEKLAARLNAARDFLLGD